MREKRSTQAVPTRWPLLGAVLGTLVLAVVGWASAATLVADYQFQDTHASSVGTPPDMTDLGPGTNSFATETINGVSTTVLTFPQDNGLSLSPTTGVIPNDSYTIALRFRFANVDGFRRIVDFKNGISDCGFYVLNGSLNFFCDVDGSGSPIAANAYVDVVLTRDSGTGAVVGYVNGAPSLSFTDSFGDAVIDPDTLRFFRDNEPPEVSGEDSAGAVSRIRLWDGPLTAEEVAALEPALDHFLCYKTKATKGSLCEPTSPSNAGGTCETEADCGGTDEDSFCLPNKFPKGLRVSLTDGLEGGPRVFDVKKPVNLCAPADKNHEGVNDLSTHLEGYQIALTKGHCTNDPAQGCVKDAECAKGGLCALQPKPVAQVGLRIANQFHSASPLVLDTVRPDRLLVPTAKDPSAPAPPPGPNGVDHYKCYTVKISKGQPKFTPITGVLVEDQFTSAPRTFDLAKPTRLCIAADKNGEGIERSDIHLLCYQAKPPKGETKFQKVTGIFVNNQFDSTAQVNTLKEDEFCVPSQEVPNPA